MLQEGLLRVVTDTDDVSPRYRVHWVEHAVQRVIDFFDNIQERLGVGEGRVCLVAASEYFLVNVLQRIARQSGLDFAKVKQRVKEEERHRR